MNETVRIVEIRLYDCRLPTGSISPRRRVRQRESHHLVISMVGELDDGTRVRGIGESDAGPAAEHGVPEDAVWRACQRLLGSLVGFELDLDRATGLDAIRRVVADGRTHLAIDDLAGASHRALGSLVIGVDAALLDVMSRACRRSTSETIGSRRRTPEPLPLSIAASVRLREVAGLVTRQLERSRIVRLQSTGKHRSDVARIEAANDAAHSVEGADELWLRVGQPLNRRGGENLVDHLCDALRDRSLSCPLVLEIPVDSVEAAIALQVRAKRSLRSRVPFRRRARLTIMPIGAIRSRDDVDRLRRGGTLEIVSLDSRDAGGLSAIVDLAEYAASVTPDVRVTLDGRPDGSDISAAAHEQLAMSIPRLDHSLIRAPTSAQRRLGANTIDQPAEDRPSGHGLELSMERVAETAVREWVSSTSNDPGVARLEYNRFDLPRLDDVLSMDGIESFVLQTEAIARSLETRRYTTATFVVPRPGGSELAGYCSSASARTAYSAVRLVTDKELTRFLLRTGGVSVAEGRAFTDREVDAAIDYGLSLGWPLVVKPRRGRKGVGVTAGISSKDELVWAIDALRRTRYRDFLVERHVAGLDYRFLVVGDRVLSVVQRVPAHVVGDGRSSLADLVVRKNVTRRANPHLATRLIKLDERSEFELQRQGVSFNTVIAEGEQILLNRTCNLSQGGDSIEVLDEVHPTFLDAATQAVACVPGLDKAGVDFLIADHRLPLESQGSVVCELNSMPGITAHHFPVRGQPVNIASMMLDSLCSEWGIDLGRSDTVSTDMTVTGLSRVGAYCRWFGREARRLGVAGSIRPSEGTASAHLSGTAELVSLMSVRACSSDGVDVPSSVETRPATARGPSGAFVVLDDDG